MGNSTPIDYTLLLNARRCTECGTDKSYEQFTKARIAKAKYTYKCNDCYDAKFKHECPVCGALVMVGRTYCSRSCVLYAVGLPQDFDPSVLDRRYEDTDLDAKFRAEVKSVLDQVIQKAYEARELRTSPKPARTSVPNRR